MQGARTRGQVAAVAAIDAMLRGGPPHAVLLAGPTGAGKTTLALDVAAALLCDSPQATARPCRTCRACRMVDAGNHPDVHRLAPGGAGQQIGIGGTDRARGVRDLLAELVLLPVEGGARVAIIEDAHRLNDEAQSALLKTLEEPPAGVVLVLCAEEEERLLPTVRSRCARVRLGPVGIRDIEAILDERGLADAPRAARLARIAAGRPGIAVTYARSPDAETIRAEIVRRLLDLRGGGVAPALVAIRELQARAVELARALEAAAAAGTAGGAASGARAGRGRGAKAGARAGARDPGAGLDPEAGTADAGASAMDGAGVDGAVPDAETGTAPSKLAAPERRRGALLLVRTWADVDRDLVLLSLGERRRVREIAHLDDLERTLAAVPGAAAPAGQGAPAAASSAPAAFLVRLARAGELLEGNASPELVLDTLAAAWGARPATAGPAR